MNQPSLERVRDLSFIVTMALLAVFVVIVVAGSLSGGGRLWDVMFWVVALPMLVASTLFTVASIRVGMEHTRLEAALGARSRRRRVPTVGLLGLVALGANVAAVFLTGRANLLNVLLALLVVALLLLLREHARREGVASRTK